MPVEVPDLLTLDQVEVDQATALLKQRLGELVPTAELNRGVLQALVVQLQGALRAAARTEVSLLQQSFSITSILANPQLADDSLVDLVAANYRVTRAPGAAAAGNLLVTVSALRPLTVPAGTVFTAAGLTFTTPAAVNVRTSPAQVAGPTDAVLQADGANWSFALPVVAAAIGAAGNLPQGTAFTPVLPPPAFVLAVAQAGFTGGVDAETSTALVNRLLAGAATRIAADALGAYGIVHDAGLFADALAVSAAGYGDKEQIRYHGLFPLATGGRLDLYVRAAALPQAYAVPVTATFVGTSGGVGLWQFSLGRDAAPGFYDVLKVLPGAVFSASLPGFAVTADVRGFDTTGLTYVPDLATAVEAAYTRFQTAAVTFADTVTATAGLVPGVSTGVYTAVVRAMPLLAATQDLLGGSGGRWRGGDVLVRAPVPCFVTASFTVTGPKGSVPPVAGALALAAAAAVNATGIVGVLPASLLVRAVHDILPATWSMSPVQLLGRLRRPDGVMQTLFGQDALTVTADPGNLVSAKTVAFFLSPNDVQVTVAAV